MALGAWSRALICSCFLTLSFPRADLGWLAVIALVPLLDASDGSSVRRAFLLGWTAGSAWFFVSLNWVSHSISHYAPIPYPVAQAIIILLAAVHGSYVGFFAMAVPISGRAGWVGTLVLPSWWVVLEVVRSWIPAPFPWLIMGSAFWDHRVVSSLYPVAGVYGASFWAASMNLLIWKAGKALMLKRRRQSARFGAAMLIAALLPAAASVAGRGGSGETIKVGIVQGNYRQEVKWMESLGKEVIDTYLRLTEHAVRKGARVVVWPETAVPFYYQSQHDVSLRVSGYAKRRGIHLIFGSPGYRVKDRRVYLYNRVYHVAPDGTEETYDKIQLVPFGEYVPFNRLIPFIERLVPGIGEFARGHWSGPFTTPVPSGALVCYEISFPGLARREVSDGTEMLVNLTNDAWFGDTWGPWQHLAMAAVRAAENGVPVVRAANTGISAAFDRRGSMTASIPLFTRDVVVVPVQTGAGTTIYTRLGDWIVIFSTAVLILSAFRFQYLRRSGRWNSTTRSRPG